MGLLGKAIAINAHTGDVSTGSHASESHVFAGIRSFLTDFHRKNPRFHVIVFQGRDAPQSAVSQGEDIYDKIACYGVEVADLPGGNILVLLPGALDRELFAHRLAHSAGLTTLSQLSADSPSLALSALSPYLQ